MLSFTLKYNAPCTLNHMGMHIFIFNLLLFFTNKETGFPFIQTEALGPYSHMLRLFYERSGVLNELSQNFSATYDDKWYRPSLRPHYM